MRRPRRDLDFLAIDEQNLLISDLMFALFLQRRILTNSCSCTAAWRGFHWTGRQKSELQLTYIYLKVIYQKGPIAVFSGLLSVSSSSSWTILMRDGPRVELHHVSQSFTPPSLERVKGQALYPLPCTGNSQRETSPDCRMRGKQAWVFAPKNVMV